MIANNNSKQYMDYKTLKTHINNNPAVHNWIKDVMNSLEDKDVVDVLKGLDLLKTVFKTKYEEIIGEAVDDNY
jgi:hypothetical protein